MRCQIQVSVQGRQRLCAVFTSVIAITCSGCAGPNLSNKSFPALSWNGGTDRLATGTIPRQHLKAPPPLNNPPSVVREPKRVLDRPAQSATRNDAPPNVKQSAKSNDPVIPHDDLATFDPLPMYAGPDKKRNSYRWNGSDKRVSVDNRSHEEKIASKSQVFESATGQRRVRVAPGDTLFAIAYRNGISTKDLMALNNMDRSEIRSGQILMLPSKTQ